MREALHADPGIRRTRFLIAFGVSPISLAVAL